MDREAAAKRTRDERWARRTGGAPRGRGGRALRITIALLSLIASADALAAGPIVVQQQGSFMAGGTVITNSGTFDPFTPTTAGQTFSGDHAYVQFQIPYTPFGRGKQNSLLMWGSFVGNSWETTPDGREGFEQIFLRRGWPVYVADRPRMGRSARSSVGSTITPTAGEEGSFVQFRLGIWPDLYPGSQFPPGPVALDQFRRWSLQSVGPGDNTVTTNAGLAAVNRIGPTVLFTHSASSTSGWFMAMQNSNLKGIYAFEPTGVVFPEGEVPPPIVTPMGTTTGTAVPLADFMKLTRIPIQMLFGDNIPSGPSPYFGLDFWYRMFTIDKQFMEAVNRHGGHVTMVHLPEIGIRGNTHFSFTDLNNVQIADIVSQYLHDEGLDQ